MYVVFPADTKRRTNVGFMSGRRLRRRPDTKPTLAQHVVFASEDEYTIKPNILVIDVVSWYNPSRHDVFKERSMLGQR